MEQEIQVIGVERKEALMKTDKSKTLIELIECGEDSPVSRFSNLPSLLNVSLKSANSQRTKAINKETENDTKIKDEGKELEILLSSIIKNHNFVADCKEFSINPSNPTNDQGETVASNCNLIKKNNKKTKKKRLKPKTRGITMIAPRKKTFIDASGNLRAMGNQKSRILERFDMIEDSISDIEDDATAEDNECYIHPNSIYGIAWDSIMMFLSLYAIVFTPVVLAFEMNENTAMTYLENAMDIVFVVDIVLNFFIAYFDFEENLIISQQKIALNYLTGWFVLDSIAAFPTGLVMNIVSSQSEGGISMASLNRATRLARVYRLIKLTKLTKLLKIIKATKKSKKDIKRIQMLEEMNISNTLIRLFKFFVSFLFMSHMATCIWIFLGKEENNSWIALNSFESLPATDLYLASLYFNWTSIFTIGYGDITPQNDDERFFTLLIMVVGIGVYSFAVSSLGNIVTSYDNLTARFHERNKVLEEIRTKFNLNYKMYSRLKKYIRYDYHTNKEEKYKFVANLPAKLRNTMVLGMYRDVIDNFHFLANKSIDFVSDVILSFRFMAVYKKEKIVNSGDKLQEMVLVKSGRLSIYLNEGSKEFKLIEVRRFEHFGDILLLSGEKSPVTVRCSSSYSDLMLLAKGDLERISNKYPEMFENIYAISSYNYSALLDLIEKRISNNQVIDVETVKSGADRKRMFFNQKQTNISSINKEDEEMCLKLSDKTPKNVFSPKLVVDSPEVRSNQMMNEISSRLKMNQRIEADTKSFFKARIKGVIEENRLKRQSEEAKTFKNMMGELKEINRKH